MKRMIIGFVAAVFLHSARPQPVQSSIYQYAFLSTSDKFKTQLVLVNPATGISAEDLRIDFDTKNLINNIWIDPTKTKGIYLNTEADGISHSWRLVDFISGKIHTITNWEQVPSLYFLPDIDANAAWSPDSKYFALKIFSRNSSHAYIYNVVRQTLREIPVAPGDSVRFAWSPDSSLLAMDRYSCQKNTCGVYLELIDPTRLKVISSVDYSLASFHPYDISGLCDLHFSPSGRYLSFTTNCDGTNFDAEKEVYLFDVNSGETMRITNLTLPILAQNERPPVSAHYNMLWYNDSTLIIGFALQILANVTGVVVIYDVTQHKSTVIAQKIVGEWAINSISKSVVGRVVSPDFITSTAETFRYTSSRLEEERTLLQGFGCKLLWSPDGTVLSQIKYSGPNCTGTLQEIQFNQADYSLISTFTKLHVKTDVDEWTHSVGWIRITP